MGGIGEGEGGRRRETRRKEREGGGRERGRKEREGGRGIKSGVNVMQCVVQSPVIQLRKVT